jgi:hypothetical protein
MIFFRPDAQEQDYLSNSGMNAWQQFWWMWQYRNIRMPHVILWRLIWYVPLWVALGLLFAVVLVMTLSWEQAVGTITGAIYD